MKVGDEHGPSAGLTPACVRVSEKTETRGASVGPSLLIENKRSLTVSFPRPLPVVVGPQPRAGLKIQ